MSSTQNNPRADSTEPITASSPTGSTTPPIYESPSPPSTKSSDGYDYGSVQAPNAPDGSVVVQLPQNRSRPLSPIQHPSNQVSHHPYSTITYAEDKDTNVTLNESTHLLSPTQQNSQLIDPNDVEEDDEILRSHDALQRDRELYELRERELEDEYKNEGRNINLFICSFAFTLIVTLVVIVSGLTELHAKREIPKLEVFSEWPDGGLIPLKYGCHAPDGKPQSFPLSWQNVPTSAKSLVVLFANPSAIRTKKFDPVHWFVTDIPVKGAGDNTLPANASSNEALMPSGASQRANAFLKSGEYFPPCSKNDTSFFVIHVYAVEASPKIEDFRDAREIIMRFVGVPFARIRGVYGKRTGLQIGAPNNSHSTTPFTHDTTNEHGKNNNQPLDNHNDDGIISHNGHHH